MKGCTVKIISNIIKISSVCLLSSTAMSADQENNDITQLQRRFPHVTINEMQGLWTITNGNSEQIADMCQIPGQNDEVVQLQKKFSHVTLKEMQDLWIMTNGNLEQIADMCQIPEQNNNRSSMTADEQLNNQKKMEEEQKRQEQESIRQQLLKENQELQKAFQNMQTTFANYVFFDLRQPGNFISRIKEYVDDLTQTNWVDNGESMLHLAAGHVQGNELVSIILPKYLGEIDLPHEHSKLTALHFAAFAGNLEALKLLLSKGANVLAETPGGVSILDAALNHLEMCLDENKGNLAIENAKSIINLILEEIYKNGLSNNGEAHGGSTQPPALNKIYEYVVSRSEKRKETVKDHLRELHKQIYTIYLEQERKRLQEAKKKEEEKKRVANSRKKYSYNYR